MKFKQPCKNLENLSNDFYFAVFGKNQRQTDQREKRKEKSETFITLPHSTIIIDMFNTQR